MATNGISIYVSSKEKKKNFDAMMFLFFSSKTFYLPVKNCGVHAITIFDDFSKLWE